MVPVREEGISWQCQGLTPHSGVVAQSVEGSLEGIKEKGTCIWVFEAHEKGGGGAPVIIC